MDTGHDSARRVCARNTKQNQVTNAVVGDSRLERAAIRTQWAATRCRSPQNVPRPRRTRGKQELCPRLPRRGRSGTRCRRQSRLSCASRGGHLRPTTPRAREICRSTSGQTCAVRACRSAALRRSRRACRRCWMGALLARDVHPTNRAHGSAWGVC